MSTKGYTWNESETYRDAWTLREVRRITTKGEINQAANYHTNIGFTADGEFMAFWTKRLDHGVICKAHVESGDITMLTEPTPDYGFEPELQGGPYPRLCIAPQKRWVVYTQGKSLRAVHLDILEERILIDDVGAEWVIGYPSVSADEQVVIVPVVPEHPQVAKGELVTRQYYDCFPDKSNMQMRLLQVPLLGGDVETIYQEDGCRTAHCPHSPTNSDLLLFDRDFPPRFWGGSDGVTNRAWILDIPSGKLTEVPSRDDSMFQVHSVWTFDGEHILYHGRSAQGGKYIGVCDRNGNLVHEYGFHDKDYYGHVSAMVDRPAILLDGDVSSDKLVLLYYDNEQPRLEVVAEHHTHWGSIIGQATHPHPLCDPTGKWISFTSAQRGRSDVFVVRI